MDGVRVKLWLGGWDSNMRFIRFSIKLGQYCQFTLVKQIRK
jgi:hypothetical protein